MQPKLSEFLNTHQGKSIKLRLAEVSDAQFILNVRLDSRYNKYLSTVDPSLTKQQQWLEQYKHDEQQGKQYYFIIVRLDNIPCGTVRIYDLQTNSFCWGSWLLNADKTLTAAIESMMLIYTIGFEFLGFNQSHFDVDKKNTGVIFFHTKYGSKHVSSDDINHYFNFDKVTYLDNIKRFKNFIKLK